MYAQLFLLFGWDLLKTMHVYHNIKRFEDTKGVTRCRKSKKDRQMAKRKRTHIYLQNTTQNLKIVQHQLHENIILLAPPLPPYQTYLQACPLTFRSSSKACLPLSYPLLKFATPLSGPFWMCFICRYQTKED